MDLNNSFNLARDLCELVGINNMVYLEYGGA
jgi:hypothetical protein